MSDIAFDQHGRPIPLPQDAVAFLVRKHRPKSPPQVVFRNAQRVTLPIDAGLHEFLQIVGHSPGRYRLLCLNELGQPCAGVPEAIVEVDDPDAAETFSASPTASAPATLVDPVTTSRTALAQMPTELLLLETMRANTEITQRLIDRLPDIMRGAAHLLQAADGAGMPRRPLPAYHAYDDDDDDEYDDEEDDDTPRAPHFLETFCKAAFAGGAGGGLGGLGRLLGGGGASSTAPTPAPTMQVPVSDVGTSASPPSAIPAIATAPPERRNAPPADPQGHLLSVLSQLNEQERGYAQRVFEHLSPAAIQQWHALLLSMSVDEAVTLIRTKAQGQES